MRVPALDLRDNTDSVPARRIVIFGHHFTSIADMTGSLIGPRVRLIFFPVVTLILWVVIAVFGLVTL